MFELQSISQPVSQSVSPSLNGNQTLQCSDTALHTTYTTYCFVLPAKPARPFNWSDQTPDMDARRLLSPRISSAACVPERQDWPAVEMLDQMLRED